MATRVFKIAGGVTDTNTDIVQGSATVGVINNYMTFESEIGVDVQVTAGKTLYITRLHLQVDNVGSNFDIGYGDDGVAAGAAAPTNAVGVLTNYKGNSTTKLEPIELTIPIPAGKFPYLKSNSAGGYLTYFEGIEV